MKQILIAVAALLMVGCSTTPNDPFIEATRNYAVKEVKEHFKSDVDPMNIEITQCDYTFDTPVRFEAINNSLTKNEHDYINGAISKDDYIKTKIELLECYERILESWVYGEMDSTVRDYTDNHRLYYCVAPVEEYDADGKMLDTAKFYIRWSSYDHKDTDQLFSTMDVLKMYYDIQIANPNNFYDDDLEYHHYNDRGTIYNEKLNKWYRTVEELEKDLKQLGYE